MNNCDQHNPNPFDFVPFPEHSTTKKISEFDAMGDLFSGYLELRIRALTPIHIVGSQRPRGIDRDSIHNRQNNKPCIPASSIRGCLRSFLEALTAGWVSQYISHYTKDYGKGNPKGRHRAYATFDGIYGAINPEFKPSVIPGHEVDVASYLFGVVLEKENNATVAHEDLAFKSKLWVEDAYFNEDDLDSKNYWIPDIQGKAFMGGPKPSASSWWYMKPSKVRNRKVTTNKGVAYMAEFLGDNYRGRKFYFHQIPDKCLSYYNPEGGCWEYSKKKPFCKINLEVLQTNHPTAKFRIYLDRVPEQILILFVLALFPGNSIRHKIGYGKAYGFGSFEFELQNAYLRQDHVEAGIPSPLDNSLDIIKNWQSIAWDKTSLEKSGVDALVDWQALNWLAMILGWDPYRFMTFTYPPFQHRYFKEGIEYIDYQAVVNNGPPGKQNMDDVAQALYYKKRTINFRLYQEKAHGWHLLKKRKP